MHLIQKYEEIKRRVYAEDYYVNLFERNAPSGVINREAVFTHLNRFWDALPDSHAILREPFIDICQVLGHNVQDLIPLDRLDSAMARYPSDEHLNVALMVEFGEFLQAHLKTWHRNQLFGPEQIASELLDTMVVAWRIAGTLDAQGELSQIIPRAEEEDKDPLTTVEANLAVAEISKRLVSPYRQVKRKAILKFGRLVYRLQLGFRDLQPYTPGYPNDAWFRFIEPQF